MRALLWAAGALVVLAGVQLFVFSARTATYFAWTVEPPLTASFLGAAYFSAAVFEWKAARATAWADARIAVPSVFVFTVATLVVSLVHLDRFHLGSSFGLGTQIVTWTWIAIYTIVPILMLWLWWRQSTALGHDPPRLRPLPAWLRAIVALQAAVLLVVGMALLVTPSRAASWWPWALTHLTGRAVGAWAFALGVAAVHALWENDARRVEPAAAAFVAFAVLEAVSVLRYRSVGEWSSWQGVAFLAFLASSALTGIAALAMAWAPERARG